MTAQETLNNVEKALDEIRPFLMSDGGDIKLLSIEDAIVKVQLEGACIRLFCKSNDPKKWCRSNH